MSSEQGGPRPSRPRTARPRIAFTQTRSRPGGWSATVKLSGVNVDMVSYSVYGPNIPMECRVDAVATCGHITRYQWDEQSATTWVHQTGHSCAPDRDTGYVSNLTVYFHKQRHFQPARDASEVITKGP